MTFINLDLNTEKGGNIGKKCLYELSPADFLISVLPDWFSTEMDEFGH